MKHLPKSCTDAIMTRVTPTKKQIHSLIISLFLFPLVNILFCQKIVHRDRFVAVCWQPDVPVSIPRQRWGRRPLATCVPSVFAGRSCPAPRSKKAKTWRGGVVEMAAEYGLVTSALSTQISTTNANKQSKTNLKALWLRTVILIPFCITGEAQVH